jgi:hypothetical protein
MLRSTRNGELYRLGAGSLSALLSLEIKNAPTMIGSGRLGCSGGVVRGRVELLFSVCGILTVASIPSIARLRGVR